MAIDELVAFIRPPEAPRDVVGDWDAAESALSIRFPNDFRQLIQRYGTGEFFAGLLILNPLNSWCLCQITEVTLGACVSERVNRLVFVTEYR